MNLPNAKVSEEFRLEFARRLQAARKFRGLRAIDVANYMNMERSAYSNYERGYRIPNVEKINKLEQFLQMPPGYLACLSGGVEDLDALADYLDDYKINIKDYVNMEEKQKKSNILLGKKDYIDIVNSLKEILDTKHFVREDIKLSPVKVSKIKREISNILKNEL